MPVKIGQPVDHGFDAPLGLLSDCHRRIEHFLSTLLTIAEVRRGAALNETDRRALESALRYFDTAAPRHSADEEDSLFPRLRSVSDPEAQVACESLRRLEADHRVADQHHAVVSRIGRQWLSEGTLSEHDARTLSGELAELDRIYRAHIRVEDEEVFPAAARVLSATDLEAVGREMAGRRGVPFTRSEPPSWSGSKDCSKL